MDSELQKSFDQWLEWDHEEETKAEIQKLADEKNFGELKKRLLSRMDFGTAGLRAKMGAGFSQMNTLTILQTVQGLLRYAQSQFSAQDLQEKVLLLILFSYLFVEIKRGRYKVLQEGLVITPGLCVSITQSTRKKFVRE